VVTILRGGLLTLLAPTLTTLRHWIFHAIRSRAFALDVALLVNRLVEKAAKRETALSLLFL
jgi:hypothetical protein